MATPSTLNIARLRAEIERGWDNKELWTALHQLVVNVSTRNAALSEIFGPSDGVMSIAVVRETDLHTRREKHRFFRDAAFMRRNDDVNLRQRIKGQLLEPLYDVIVGLEPTSQLEGIAEHAAAAIDNLLFDADPTEVDSHRWSAVLIASELWWRTLRSTAPFRVLARILQAKNVVSNTDASTIHALLSDPLPQPTQSDTKAVARIGIGFAKLVRQDTLLLECGLWLQSRSVTMAGSPCSSDTSQPEIAREDTDSEMKLFSMVGTYSLEKARPGEIDAYSEQLQETVRVMYALQPGDRFAELYIQEVNLQSVWAFQTFLEKVQPPQGFAQTFWLGPGAPLPKDEAAIAFVIALARLGIRPDVACDLLDERDPGVIDLLVNHDGVEKVACALVSNNLSRLSEVLVPVTVQRLDKMISEFARLDLESAYAAMVRNESRREADACRRMEDVQASVNRQLARSEIVDRIVANDAVSGDALRRSNVPLRWFQVDTDDYYPQMTRAIADLHCHAVEPDAAWLHATLVNHVPGIVEGIDIQKSKVSTDFGQAFYLSDFHHIAEAAVWASRMATRAPLVDLPPPDCAIIVYHVEQDVLNRFQGVTFPSPISGAPDPEWQNCVRLFRSRTNLDRASRKRRGELAKKDYIYGPVAGTRHAGSCAHALPKWSPRGSQPQLAVKSDVLASAFDNSIASVWVFERREWPTP
jgi:hypothetical protein